MKWRPAACPSRSAVSAVIGASLARPRTPSVPKSFLAIVASQLASRFRALHRAAACRVSCTSCTRSTCAPWRKASSATAIEPGARSRASGASPIVPMKRLREAPNRIAQPSPCRSGEAADEREVVGDGLAEADPRVDEDAVARDAGGLGRGDPLLEHVEDVEEHVVVGGRVLHGLRVAERVHQADRRAAVGGEGEAAGVVAQRRDVVEEVGAGVEGRCAPRRRCGCRSRSAARSPRRGARRSPARCGRSPRRAAPARRRAGSNSPPMSRMSAPASARARAAASASAASRAGRRRRSCRG